MEFWWRPLSFLTGLAFIGLIAGSNYGAAAGWRLVVVGLVLTLAYHLRLIKKLTDWLANPGSPLPAGTGMWGEALYRLEKLLRKRDKQRKKALSDLEQMREATRSLPDGVVILDRDLRIDWLNDAAEQMLGLSAGRDLGQFLVYLVRQNRFSEWLQGSDFSQSIPLDAPTAKGHTLDLQLVRLPRKQKMLIARDVTEMLRVDAMRRDFVANVSHELRSPLTVIAAYLEGFEEMPEIDPAELRKHLPQMRQQSDRMRRLIDDLLMLARLESISEIHEGEVDAPALVDRLLHEATDLSQGTHDIRRGGICPFRLRGNGEELYTAFVNLVSNAVRYTPPGGSITLKWAATENGGAEFAVTDTGVGIDAQHIPRLTERFYRVDQGRSRASGGTGLGLAIVKHILQRHQARLRIDSTIGKGSTFAAVFPAERIILPEAAVPEEAGQAGN